MGITGGQGHKEYCNILTFLPWKTKVGQKSIKKVLISHKCESVHDSRRGQVCPWKLLLTYRSPTTFMNICTVINICHQPNDKWPLFSVFLSMFVFSLCSLKPISDRPVLTGKTFQLQQLLQQLFTGYCWWKSYGLSAVLEKQQDSSIIHKYLSSPNKVSTLVCL